MFARFSRYLDDGRGESRGYLITSGGTQSCGSAGLGISAGGGGKSGALITQLLIATAAQQASGTGPHESDPLSRGAKTPGRFSTTSVSVDNIVTDHVHGRRAAV